MRLALFETPAMKVREVSGICRHQDTALLTRQEQLGFVIASVHCKIERRFNVDAVASQSSNQSMLGTILIEVKLHTLGSKWQL